MHCLTWLEAPRRQRPARMIAPLVIVALALPVIVVLSLLLVALFMTPALVSLVAKRRFADLEAKRGAALWQSVLWSLGCTLLALLALVLSIPLWFVPPLVLVLPPLIWGWLTYRVMAFDVLAEHASADERRTILREHRWPLLAIGVIAGYLGAAPTLLWALGRGGADLRAAAGAGVGVALHAGLRVCRTVVRALRAGGIAAACASTNASIGHCATHVEALRTTHELRPDHRRRRDPLRQAPGQAPAQGHRTAGRARPGAGLGALRRRRPAAASPQALRDAFASGDVVFCCGGIGATPDDHTRQCAAAALGVPLALHPEAEALITERMRDVAAEQGLPFEPDARRQRASPEHGRVPGGRADHRQPVQQDPRLLGRRRCTSCPASR